MSTITHPLLLRLVASAARVSSLAGTIIKDVRNKGDLGIIDKGVNDLQTEADRSSQRCIISLLLQQFPKAKIIGEEENIEIAGYKLPQEDTSLCKTSESILSSKCPDKLVDLKEEQVVIWVDPLDGTSEFAEGLLEHVTVLIGISVEGEAVAGVIHQPFFNKDSHEGRTIWGIVGGEYGGFELKYPPEGTMILTTSRSHLSKASLVAIDAIKPTDVIRAGGAGYKAVIVLEGRAHCYIHASPGCKKWDTCAAEAVMRSAGGVLTDIAGTPYSYSSSVAYPNKTGVLASCNTEVHDKLLTMIPDEVKKFLK